MHGYVTIAAIWTTTLRAIAQESGTPAAAEKETPGVAGLILGHFPMVGCNMGV